MFMADTMQESMAWFATKRFAILRRETRQFDNVQPLLTRSHVGMVNKYKYNHNAIDKNTNKIRHMLNS